MAAAAIAHIVAQSHQTLSQSVGLLGILTQQVEHEAEGRFTAYTGKFGGF